MNLTWVDEGTSQSPRQSLYRGTVVKLNYIVNFQKNKNMTKTIAEINMGHQPCNKHKFTVDYDKNHPTACLICGKWAVNCFNCGINHHEKGWESCTNEGYRKFKIMMRSNDRRTR